MRIGAREIDVQVDVGTWNPPTSVPPEILALDGVSWSADMDAVLTQIALWTRPPTITGFDLADLWAWFRYGRALEGTPELRLSSPWTEIDAHQKTLLSDDFGVGLNSLLLIERLGMQFLGETRYVMDVVKPDHFQFQNRPKQGPAKAPDYLMTDMAGNCHAVEFKGTQADRRVLGGSMDVGVAQKKNLIPKAGHTLASSLVMGVFIPQHWSAERASLCIRDPDIGDLGKVLKKIPKADLRAAIVQITLAKCFALAGLADHATILARTPVSELMELDGSTLSELDFEEVGDSKANLKNVVTWDEVTVRTRAAVSDKGTSEFSIEMPRSLLNNLHSATSVGGFLKNLSTSTLKKAWTIKSSSSGVTLTSPLGVTLRIA